MVKRIFYEFFERMPSFKRPADYKDEDQLKFVRNEEDIDIYQTLSLNGG